LPTIFFAAVFFAAFFTGFFAVFDFFATNILLLGSKTPRF